MNIVRFQGENQNIFYEFDRDSAPLGEGGMGRIYQGVRVDTANNFQAIVAVKCLRPELVSNVTVVQRAQREASVQLSHPNLIRMYGFFSGAEYNQYSASYMQTYYISMERLLGVNLDEILFKGITTDKSGLSVPLADELSRQYGTDREQTVVTIMQSILSGVSFLHKNGFIHRDLDPSNVMVTQDGQIKVIDFGICKRIGSYSYGGGLTQAGQFLGKVAYSAPELLLGDIKSQDQRTDIYALGIMMAQLLTGYLPATGTDQDVMNAHLKGKLDFSAISNKKLRKVVEKATDKDQKRRYSSVEEFMSAISEVPLVRGAQSNFESAPSIPETAPSFPPQQSEASFGSTVTGTAIDSQPHGATAFSASAAAEESAPASYERKESQPIPSFIIPICCIAGLVAGIIIAFIL